MKKLTFLSALLLFGSFIVNAQKLPNKQEVSLRAPANVKVDGIYSEWGETLQAYNKGTELYYTIANDDDNLYLTVQAVNPRVVQKIIMTGLTLSVNSSGKKDEAHDPAVMFPLMSFVNSKRVLMNAGILPDVMHDHKASAVDTFMEAANKGLTNNIKEIKVLNINSIVDTVLGVMTDKRPYFRNFSSFHQAGRYIRINNNDGIKVMVHLDDKKVLTYELAIPLKYFGLSKGTQRKFSYNIKINGVEDPKDPQEDILLGFTVSQYRSPNGNVVTADEDLLYPTDFWGEYTLAK